MARIRTVKPEFWKNESLSSLPEAAHLLAAALLNYADDFGYFNANPKLISAECFPLRELSVSVPEILRSLQSIGYIALGTGPDGRRYGHIVGFCKHQKVSHPTESKIADISITWDVFENILEPLRNPPESFRPDLNREQGTGNREQGKELWATAHMSAEADLLPADGRQAEKIPVAKIVAMYHELLPMCPQVRKLTAAREAKIRARWRSGDLPDLETWRDYFAFVAESKFLTGRTTPAPGRKIFVADLEWLATEGNYAKVYERKYHDEQVQAR